MPESAPAHQHPYAQVPPTGLHDPSQRRLAWEVDGWEMRFFALDDPKLAWLVTHGCAHVQLWRPDAGVSVITPCRMTGGAWEIQGPRGPRTRFEEVAELRGWMAQRYELPFGPCGCTEGWLGCRLARLATFVLGNGGEGDA